MFRPEVPAAQRTSQLAKFEDTVKPRVALQRVSSDPVRALEAPIVPGYADARYAPDHPRADWGGLVATQPGRSHIRGRAHATHLEREGGGIVASEVRLHGDDPSTNPLGWGSSRKHFRPQRDSGPLPQQQSDAGAYLTTTQAAFRGGLDGDVGRKRHTGKRHVRPPYDDHYQDRRPPAGTSSMLAAAASALVDAVDDPPPIAMPSQAKFDPHSTCLDHLPGYTGVRR